MNGSTVTPPPPTQSKNIRAGLCPKSNMRLGCHSASLGCSSAFATPCQVEIVARISKPEIPAFRTDSLAFFTIKRSNILKSRHRTPPRLDRFKSCCLRIERPSHCPSREHPSVSAESSLESVYIPIANDAANLLMVSTTLRDCTPRF
jgi:hypothetical protein